jgi:hypothetical protein
LQIDRQAQECSKPLLISAFTRRTFWSALRVYARKRIGMVLDARMVMLLIQSMFTSLNGDFGPVYRQQPIWG